MKAGPQGRKSLEFQTRGGPLSPGLPSGRSPWTRDVGPSPTAKPGVLVAEEKWGPYAGSDSRLVSPGGPSYVKRGGSQDRGLPTPLAVRDLRVPIPPRVDEVRQEALERRPPGLVVVERQRGRATPPSPRVEWSTAVGPTFRPAWGICVCPQVGGGGVLSEVS